MLRQARARLPRCSFVQANFASWNPAPRTDLLFASGSLQWVPDHHTLLRRWLEKLPQGGVLALQMPDNVEEPALALMKEVAGKGPWAGNRALRKVACEAPASPDAYYDLLKPICAELDIWHTVCNHVMVGPEDIVEWFRGSVLLPYLSALKGPMADDFLATYTAEIGRHYAARFDGSLLLRFPRLFIVARR